MHLPGLSWWLPVAFLLLVASIGAALAAAAPIPCADRPVDNNLDEKNDANNLAILSVPVQTAS